ncbi:helix-turn-helix domain-containing protein [Maribellus sp. YY47]|uniref:helix-turn-helix domain-containing protein n=1 Tax=Maribellus sp. YY47 TaxID=2929486 RepID=UPI002001D701|nr:helix-turn-helix domain-containing protein [Maribellus sp. YY47]MCK3686161.1 helix-turn-helix domain-containing protein [Maribellus sp. YY47]
MELILSTPEDLKEIVKVALAEFKNQEQQQLEKTHQIPQVQPLQELITVDELAELLHLSKPTVYSNYSKGLIPGGCKQGKRVLFDKQIILDWVRSGRKLSNAEIEAEAENFLATRKKGGRRNG